jgi:hypothetical protein
MLGNTCSWQHRGHEARYFWGFAGQVENRSTVDHLKRRFIVHGRGAVPSHTRWRILVDMSTASHCAQGPVSNIQTSSLQLVKALVGLEAGTFGLGAYGWNAVNQPGRYQNSTSSVNTTYTRRTEYFFRPSPTASFYGNHLLTPLCT